MKFIREIPLTLIKEKEILHLHQFGFTLVWKSESVEVWA